MIRHCREWPLHHEGHANQTQQLSDKLCNINHHESLSRLREASSDRNQHVNATRRVRPQRARHNLHPTTKRSAQHEVVHNHSNHGLIHRILRIQSCETRNWKCDFAAADVHIRVSFSQYQRSSSTADGSVNHHACRTQPSASRSSRGTSRTARRSQAAEGQGRAPVHPL